MAVQQSTFTRRGVERVVRFAFERAQERRGRLMSATKSNGIIHTMPFWDQIVEELSPEYPDVTVEKMHIDALAAAFVLRPAYFDVVVGSNLFGDILSDLAAGVAGSIGIAPSGNLDPTRTYPSMFEPVHGSAPDIAGRGIANPIGQVWSGAMMLRHFGEDAAADAIEATIAETVESSAVRTGDLGGCASTVEVVDEMIKVLRRSAG
jgi:tartrate dehydrogenase/decarboxylase/D-malate dehydrogenase